MTEVRLTSERKGSNPGGKAIITTKEWQMPVYIKYCPGNHIPPAYGFNSQNQPVYEAITAEMARTMELNVPNFYVLLNNKQDVRFTNSNGEKLDPKRKCYFVSELIPIPRDEDLKKADSAMQREEIYRDLLLIANIVGRKENYLYLNTPPFKGLYYIDVGCNFVHAHEGYIALRSSIFKSLNANKKEVKRALRELSKYCLVLKSGLKLPLEQLATMPNALLVPTLNPHTNAKVTSLLTAEEMENITKILAINMAHIAKRERNSPLVKKMSEA